MFLTKYFCLVLGLLAFLPAVIFAHPHSWVDWAGTVQVTDDGLIQSLDMELTWDEWYSSMTIADFPDILKNKLPNKRLPEVNKSFGLGSIEWQRWLTVAWDNKSLTLPAPPELIGLSYKEPRITFKYHIPLHLNLQKVGTLTLSIIDPSYYTDMGIRGSNPAQLAGSNKIHLATSFKEDRAHPYYYGQVYPEIIVFTLTK